MAQEIFVIKTMGDALRNTGYKNIESAMSEIIDNSIQAEAKNVFVIVSEQVNPNTGRKNISEIAFLDDGNGMSEDELGKCLGIGFSTRTERKGMGRFGVGLPQSSLYACPSVEVYSWQNGYENCQKVFLDIEKVRDGTQTQIDDPCKSPIPEKYKKYLKYKMQAEQFDFSPHGTFVLWKNCDRVNPKTISFLFGRLEFALGQKFRYFISVRQSNIWLIPENNQDSLKQVMPNDPLMLMENNYVLGNPEKPGEIVKGNNKDFNTPVFEPYGNEGHPDGVFPVPVKYMDQAGKVKEGTVTIKFSKVKNIFYDQTAIKGNPGNTDLGKHVKKLEGISVVRASREIDFGQFDFYENINQPEHRWWGCEINFLPELDEAFGVANNKQHVELHKVDPLDYEFDEVKPMWLQLYDFISKAISNMYKANKKTRENARTLKEVTPPSVPIINIVEGNDPDPEPSSSEKIKEETPVEQLEEKAEKELKYQGNENPTKEDVRSYLNNKVNIRHCNLGRTAGIFDYSFELGNCKVELNQEHIFYKTTLEKIFSNVDVKTAFELFIASFVKAIDETNITQAEQNDNLVQKWNEKLRRYINEQQNFAK